MQKNKEPMPTDYRGRPFKKKASSKDELTTKNWAVELADKAKVTRDITLGALGIVYFTGFVVWSYSAFQHHLGLVPIVQAQYLAAGIIPLILMVGIFFLSRSTVSVSADFTDDMDYYKYVGRLTVLSCILMGLIWLHSWELHISIKTSLFYQSALWLVMTSLLTIASGSRWWRLNRNLTPKGLTILHMCLSSLPWISTMAWYCNVFYPLVPQEFGGMQPRRAVISVKRTDLASFERKMLLAPVDQIEPADPSKDPDPVVRTVALSVLYDNGDSIEFMTYGTSDTAVYELKRSNIVAITWYGYEFPKVANYGATLPILTPINKPSVTQQT